MELGTFDLSLAVAVELAFKVIAVFLIGLGVLSAWDLIRASHSKNQWQHDWRRHSSGRDDR